MPFVQVTDPATGKQIWKKMTAAEASAAAAGTAAHLLVGSGRGGASGAEIARGEAAAPKYESTIDPVTGLKVWKTPSATDGGGGGGGAAGAGVGEEELARLRSLPRTGCGADGAGWDVVALKRSDAGAAWFITTRQGTVVCKVRGTTLGYGGASKGTTGRG